MNPTSALIYSQLIGEGVDWEERAAIIEHDGGHNRADAENLARSEANRIARPWPEPIAEVSAGPLLREWVAGLS